MNTKILRTSEEFYQLKDQWEKLQEEDEHITYYSTFQFIKTWWNVYKDATNNSLFIVCAYQDNKIIAIAPLMIETVKKSMLSYNVLKYLGRGDYLNFIIDNSDGLGKASIKCIFREIFSSREWDRLQLSHITYNSLLAYYLLSHREYNKSFHYLIECPVIDFIKYDSFDKYKKDYNIYKEFKRYINKFKSEAGYKFRVVKNSEFDLYEKISKLHILQQEYLVRDKGRKERESLFNNSNNSKFVKNIYKNNENIITFILEDNHSNLLSYYTCYIYKDTYLMWNTAYNPQFEKYGLIKILTYEVVKYMFENEPTRKFDFGAGRYPWKFKWTKDFVLDYEFDFWNTVSKRSRFLKLLYDLKNKLIGS
jgi:hypothetical protein